MVFSSIIFLFQFLPLVLVGYVLMPKGLRNLFLLFASLFFYAWGEGIYLLVMLFVILVNYFSGLAFARLHGAGRSLLLVAALGINLLPLLYYKYAAFLGANYNILAEGLSLLPQISPPQAHLPLGISFFTFQAISYLVDIYRRTCPAQTNPIHLGLYIALFPQLIAGPIVRYHDIARQLVSRKVTAEGFASGVERFILGLGKKVLLANNLGHIADVVYALPAEQLSASAAWLGTICYTLQIYYDFSGYSDMAIGLGRMFGFTFLENFNYPYISRSVREFWQRWHISLSNWFRDYLYIPLGGNRKGSWRTITNLFTVFLLCGLWHGASWTFLLWGAFHGLFLALERGSWGRLLNALPRFLQHSYALLVVMVGWVFFRAENLDDGVRMTKALFGGGSGSGLPYTLLMGVDLLFVTILLLALLGMVPLLPRIRQRLAESTRGPARALVLAGSKISLLGVVFLLCLASLATGVYNPFIYFRF